MTENNDTNPDRQPETETETTPNDTMNVDLSPDDTERDTTPQTRETERDGEQSGRMAATNTSPVHGEESADEYDAAAEAKRLIKNSDGDTAGERAENAIEQVQQHLTQISQRLQQVRQRETKTEDRIQDLQEARVHVRRAPDGVDVFRSFGAGITVGVPHADAYGSHEDDERVPDPDAGMDGNDEMPDEAGVAPAEDHVDFSGVYDRDDLVRDIDDTLESEQGTLAQLREEQSKLSGGIGNAEAILRELNDYLDKASWLGDDTDDPTPEQSHAQTGHATNRARQPEEGLTPEQIAQRRQQGIGVERDTEQSRRDRQQSAKRAEQAQQTGGQQPPQMGGQQPSQTPPRTRSPPQSPPRNVESGVTPDVDAGAEVDSVVSEDVDAGADTDAETGVDE